MNLSVIIPAYNEEARLPKTVSALSTYLQKQNYSSEIIIVNDGSKDGTAKIANELAGQISNLKLIDNKINKGKGGAVHDGILLATGECRLFMDADGSTPPESIEKLLPYFNQGYEVVISSRRIEGAKINTEQPWYRLTLGWAFRQIVSIIVPLGVKDSQNGFKMFSAKAVEDLFSKQTIFRWAFDVEILALARKFGYKIKEVPIEWTDSEGSKVTLRGMVNMLREIIQIRLNLWREKYGK